MISSAAGGFIPSEKTDLIEKSTSYEVLFSGGAGETRTLAPGFSRPTPLAGAPRHQLEYCSLVTFFLFLDKKNGGESGIRTHGTRKGTTVFKTVPL